MIDVSWQQCRQWFVYMIILNIVVSSNFCTPHQDKYNRPLKHKAIPTLDGMSGALDGTTIANFYNLMRDIYRMLYGVKDSETGQRVGLYIFNNEPYSGNQLARLEASMTPEERITLQPLLQKVKEDVVTIMHDFIDDARGARDLIDQITKDWAHVRNRPNSLLLTWGKQKDGHEVEYFFSEIDSFEKIVIFANDLLSFLDDLIASCPVGMKQYQELKEKSRKRAAH